MLRDAIRLARERIIDGVAPDLDEQWLADNFSMILCYLAEGHDVRAVSGLLGISETEWNKLYYESEKFRQTIDVGEQLRMSVFEEMRNGLCRGDFRGSAPAVLHALDRQHARSYYGRPGVYTPEDDEQEQMTFEQAQALLRGYGVLVNKSDA